MRAGTTNEKGRCARIFHLIVRILTLPPIVIGITVLLMYAPAKLMTLRELLLFGRQLSDLLMGRFAFLSRFRGLYGVRLTDDGLAVPAHGQP